MKLGSAHERVKDALRRHEDKFGGCTASDAKLASFLAIDERDLSGLLADLDGAGLIRIARSGGTRVIRRTAASKSPDDMLAELRAAAPSAPAGGGVSPSLQLDTPTAPPKSEGIAIMATPSKPSAATKPRFAAPLGRPPSIENRHPDELKIDDSYQRSTDTGPSRALIERIAKGWDWRMCLPLVVSKRRDELFVIDGQHRLAAAKMRGDIQWLPCCIAVYGDVADEAAMFVAMNRQRRAINRLDDFHADQAGGNEEALAIAKIVTSVGFTVSRRTGSASWVPGEVAFTSSIAKVRRKHGDQLVRDALAMMAAAFAGERLVAGSSVFTALCAIMVSPPAGFERGRLQNALRTFDMKGWADFLTNSKGGDDRASKLRQMLLAAYEDVEKAA